MKLQEALNRAIITQQARAGVSNKELAEALGVSPAMVVKYRNGTAPWKLSEADAIAEALKLENGWELLNLAQNEYNIDQHSAQAA